ncbi:MAG: hypothetical protein ACKVQV_14565 [Bacteroidia bacterium]
MKKNILIVFCFVLLAQMGVSQTWQIIIKDNMAKMEMEQSYRITNDSLIITGKSDYGRTNVDYLLRALTPKEQKQIASILRTFPADSLKPDYFDGYADFKTIDAENYPRSIEIRIENKGKMVSSRATNAWVRLHIQLINSLNPFFPKEVQILLDKSKFNVFY